MELRFTQEQEMMRNMVRDFAEKEVIKEIPKMKNHQFPEDTIKKMGELGLMGIPVPEQYGGSGMDLVSYIIAVNELSRVSATVGVILSVHTTLGTMPILEYGTEEQKQKYVPKLASGDYIGAFALTEPDAGSDAASLKLRADKQGEEYVLNGSKIFITNGLEASVFLVLARTDGSAGSKGISAFIVDKDTPGLEIGKNENKMGLHGSSTVVLAFNNCVVHQDQLLGKEGEGFKIAMGNLNAGRVGIAAQGLGIAEASLKASTAYAKEREQFGKPIAYNQGISFKLADMATEVEAARLLVYRAASKLAAGTISPEEASMAKMFATQTARKCAIEAVQVFGGYGYTEDYEVERYFRDAKITEIYEGTNEIQRLVISKQILS